MASVGVVFIHGLFSSSKVWTGFDGLIGDDPDLGQLDLLHFGYSSPVIRVNPLRRIPNFNDLADSLGVYLDVEAGHYRHLVLVSHSQGGLVIQRFLARMLARGRGLDLARIRQIVMFACPHTGSELALSLRRAVWPGREHPQERDLRPLSAAVAEAHEAVLNRIVHAQTVSAHECRIPIKVYAGDADNVVTSISARSVFPDAGMLPGDHFSIVRPDGSTHRSYTALKQHLEAVLRTSVVAEVPQVPQQDVRSLMGVVASGQPRESVVSSVRRALDTGDRVIVLHGLPRCGKTTAVRDVLDGATGWKTVHFFDVGRMSADEVAGIGSGLGTPVADGTRTPDPAGVDRRSRRLVVLDDITPDAATAGLIRTLTRDPDVVVIATSRRQPDDDLLARLVAVPPLTREESRLILAYETAQDRRAVDLDEAMRLFPAHVLSVPGALRAFLAEARLSPPALLVDQALPAAVEREIQPVTNLVAELRAEDRAILAYLVTVEGVAISDLIAGGLVDRAVILPAIRRLSVQDLVTQDAGAIEVPAVVAAVLAVVDPTARPTAEAAVVAAVHAAVSGPGIPFTPALAAALPRLARVWLRSEEFTNADGQVRDDLVDGLNRQGYWTDYIALSRVMIDVMDERGDRAGAVASRCRLARKVAQQGDLDLGWSLLREVDALIGQDGPVEARAELHSHRAFLAHLHGDSAFALQELRLSITLRAGIRDQSGLLVAHKLEGNIMLQRGDYHAASECYLAALECDTAAESPQRLEAETSLALCEMHLGDDEAAGRRLDGLISRMRSGAVDIELPRALHLAALLAESRGLPALALDFARQAAGRNARDPAVRAAVERTVWRMERYGPIVERNSDMSRDAG